MKKLIILILVFTASHLFAQDKTQSTNEFIITGKVKAKKRVSLSDLQQYNSIELTDVNISCSSKREEKVKSLKAVLIKDVLDSVSFQYERPGMLNHYYFLFVASDDYKVVFSFNEVYNTEIGRNLYIVTETDGRKVNETDNRILVLTTQDIKAGARNIKWLSKIVVCNAE